MQRDSSEGRGMVENPLICNVYQFIKRHRMLKSGDGVVVALSGGPDSIFLLNALHSLKDRLGISIYAVHVNHKARESAESDADFVAKVCEEFDCPLLTVERDVPGYAEEMRISFEEAGRIIRLEAFHAAMEKFSAVRTATGHTADDQAETLLMRLVWGTGKEGLAGIYPVYEKSVIRPLLNIQKDDIIRFLNENGIGFVTDATNFQPVTLRNRVRNILMPVLKRDFNPGIVEALCRTACIFQEELEYPDRLAGFYLDRYACFGKNEASLNISAMASLAPYMVKYLLRKFVKRFSGGNLKSISYEHTSAIFDMLGRPTGSRMQIPGGYILEKIYQELIITSSNAVEEALPAVNLVIPGDNFISRWNLYFKGSIIERFIPPSEDEPYSVYVDYDLCGDRPFSLRPRQAGDRFVPLGMEGSRKLKDFFIDLKIPRKSRNRVPVVLCGNEILWVAGYRQSQRFRITAGTKRVLLLRIEETGLYEHD